MTTSTPVEAAAPRATVSQESSSSVRTPASGARTDRRDSTPAIGSAPAQQEKSSGVPTRRAARRSGSVFVWKRSIDLLCILISLPFVLPLMAAVAIWIKLVSRGPAIFRQERIGRNGQRFTLYKFRTMHVNADVSPHSMHFMRLVQTNSPMVKLDLLCDNRLIPMGCLLRAAGLDELPQLWNVLRGEMSLVGPRPCLPTEYRFFTRPQRVRFQALPGLTGIWQTQGKELCTFTEMNAMDADYVRNASLFLDVSLMLRTPLALLRQMRMAVRNRRSVKHVGKPVAVMLDGQPFETRGIEGTR